MAKRMIGWTCLLGIVASAGLLRAAPPSVLPAGARLNDERLGAPRSRPSGPGLQTGWPSIGR